MTDLVSRTKIILPHRRKEIVSRQRILKLLYDLLDNKLILVIAPAGYGKTSLLVDFASQLDQPVCWYSLDEFDRTPQRFFAYFIASLRQVFPAFGDISLTALESLNPFKPDINQLVTVIVNDAYEHIQDHFLLVLDDYHLICDVPEIENFINQFLLESAENCHLVLTSRTLLSIPDLPLLVARSQVGGIGFEELAFQADEIQALVLQNYHVTLPESTAQDLARETDGWITGLILSAQTIQTGMTKQLRAARVSGVGLYSYLAQQVLDQQLPEMREFLFHTAFLEEFDAMLCQEIWGAQTNWAALIEILIQRNLFVLPVGENGNCLRYNHLFRDFLQAQFKKEFPQDIPCLLKKIAGAYTRREEWERAYSIYLQLNDANAIADLIEKAGTYLVKTAQFSTLFNWLDVLPADLLASRPRLVSHKGAVLLMQGKVTNGLTFLSHAQEMQRESNDRPGLARTLARRSTAYRYLGNYQASISDGLEALSLTEEDEELRLVQAEAYRAMGMSHYHLGNLDEAIQRFSQSIRLYKSCQDQSNVSLVNMELGICYQLQGKNRQAIQYYNQALKFWENIRNTARQSYVLNNIGELHYLSGEYIEAAKLFETAITLARKSGIVRSEAYLLYNIANLYSNLEAYDSAKEALQRTREICKSLDDHFLQLSIELSEAAIARQEGKLTQAHQYLNSAFQLVDKSLSDFENGLWDLETGRLFLAEDENQQAERYLVNAMNLFLSGGQKIEAASSSLLLARAYSLRGDHDHVKVCLLRAFQLISDLESIHPVILVGREVKGLLQEWSDDPQMGATINQLLDQIEHFQHQIIPLRRRLRQQTTIVLLAPPQLTIQGLGRSQIKMDGKVITNPNWVNQKRARELLFYLLSHPEGKTKEEIGVDLWPDSSPVKLKIQFRNTVYFLRCALGQETVVFYENRYFFNKDLDYVYDVQEFDSRIEQAASTHVPQEKLEHLKAAIGYYQGPFFLEGGGIWALSEQQRVLIRYLEALLSIANISLDLGNIETALLYSQRALSEDRCQEEAHRIAMKVFAARGDRAGVIHQYEECSLALQEDLNSEPSPETTQLLKALRQ